MQGGGPTPVFNRSLYGLVDEAASAGAFGRVLGAVFGLDGLLDDRLIDLTGRSQRAWRMVARTPGAALGSSRRKLAHEDASTVLDVLDAEQELLDAQVSLVLDQRDAIVASYQLLAAVGRLTARDLGLTVNRYDQKSHYLRVRDRLWGYEEEPAKPNMPKKK